MTDYLSITTSTCTLSIFLSPVHLLEEFRVFRQDVVQPLPLLTLVEPEARSDAVQLVLLLPNEVIRPLLHEKLCHKDVPREPADPCIELPHGEGVELPELGRDLLHDVVYQRLVDVSDGSIVRAPGVNGETVFLGEEILEECHVWRLLGHVDHPLVPDVLVQPDSPAETVLVVDIELVFEDLVAHGVDGVCSIPIILPPRIDRAPFAIPHAEPVLVHPLPFLLVAPPEPVLLRLAGHVVLRRGGEAEEGVVVDRVGRVVPLLVDVAKVAKVGGEGVAVEEDGVVGVDGADGFVDAVVKGEDAGVLGIGGLVDGVVACDPFVGFEVLGEAFPEPYGAVLEIFVVPEVRDMSSVVRMPVGILPTRGGMQI